MYIRTRLTLWFLLILTLVLAAFSFFCFFALLCNFQCMRFGQGSQLLLLTCG